MFNLGWMEILILAFLGLLIFGRRLPEVGKNLGKGIVEFKKGLSGVEDEIGSAARMTQAPPAAAPRLEDQNANRVSVEEELRQTQARLQRLEEELRKSREG